MFLRRVLISNLGHSSAFYRGTLFDFTNEEGEAAHAATLASNGQGKTTMLSMVFSVFDPSKRNFVQTQQNSGHKFGEYLSEKLGCVALEMENPESRSGSPSRLVVGWLYCKEREASGKPRQFFAFPVMGERTLDALPFSGTSVPEEQQLVSWDEVAKFKKLWSQPIDGAEGATFIESATEWKEYLTNDLNIPVELIVNQTRLCKTEGGLAELFKKIKTNADGLANMTQWFGLDDLAQEQSERLRKATQKIANRSIYQRDIAAITALQEGIAESDAKFVASDHAKSVLERAQFDLSELGHFLGGLSLDNSAKLMVKRGLLGELNARFAALTKEHRRAVGETEIFRVLAAEAERKLELDKKKELTAAIERVKIRIQAVRSAAILNDIEVLNKKVEAKRDTVARMRAGAEADIAPVRDAGSRLSAVLKRDISTLQTQLSSIRSDIAAWGTDKGKAEIDANEAGLRINKLESDLKTIALIENDLSKLMADALADGLREEPEDLAQAVARLDESVHDLRARVEEVESSREAARHDLRDAEQSRSDIGKELAFAQRDLDQAEADFDKRKAEYESFMNDDAVSKLFADANKDPRDAQAESFVAERRSASKLAATEMQQTLTEKRKLAEANENGLARVDVNLEKALGCLRDAGIEATASASYIAETVPDVEKAKLIVESDTGRFFYGITLANPADMERVRALDTRKFGLDAPIEVSAPSHDVQKRSHSRVVLKPFSDGAYNKRRLKEDLAFLKSDIEELTQKLGKANETARIIDEVHTRLAGLRAKELDLPLALLEERLEKATDIVANLNDSLSEADETVSEKKAAVEKLQAEYDVARKLFGKLQDDHRRLSSMHDRYESDRQRLLSYGDKQSIEKSLNDAFDARTSALARAQALAANINLANSTAFDISSQSSRLETEEKNIRRDHVTEVLEDLTGLTVDVATGLYESLRSDWAMKYEGIDFHETELQQLDKQLAAKEADFERDCLEVFDAFPGLDRTDFVAEARSSAMLSDDVRRQSVQQLQAEQSRLDQSLLAQSELIGGINMRCKVVLPEVCKAHGIEFNELFETIRSTVGVDLALAEAETMRSQAEFTSVDIQDRLSLVAEQQAAVDTEVKQLEKREETLNLATRLPSVRTAMAADTRSPDEFQLEFASLDTSAAVMNQVSVFEAKINEASKVHQRAESAFNKQKLALRDKCDTMLGGKLSLEVKSTIEKYRLSAMGDFWAVEPASMQRLSSTIKSLQHDLDTMSEDERHCVTILSDLLGTSLNTFKRATTVRIPADAGRFSNALILKSSFRFGDVSEESRMICARQHLDMLIEDVSAEEGVVIDGHRLINGLLNRLARLEGRTEGFKFSILVPVIQDDNLSYADLSEMKGSGGQVLTSAFLLYVLTASIRNSTGRKNVGGVFLLLDNPLGAASAKALVQAQVAIAKAMNIQIVIVTPSTDSDPLSCFNVINTLHLKKSAIRTIVGVTKEASDIFTAKHSFDWDEAA